MAPWEVADKGGRIGSGVVSRGVEVFGLLLLPRSVVSRRIGLLPIWFSVSIVAQQGGVYLQHAGSRNGALNRAKQVPPLTARAGCMPRAGCRIGAKKQSKAVATNG